MGPFEFALQPGPNSRLFTIDAAGNLKTTGALLQSGVYTLNVVTEDGTGISVSLPIQFAVIASTTPPTSTTLSANTATAFSPIGTPIGSLSTIDPNFGVTESYTVLDPSTGKTSKQFTVDGRGNLATADVFKNTVPTTVALTIRTTNSLGQSLETPIAITIHPVRVTGNLELSSSIVDAGAVSTLSTVNDSNVGRTFTLAIDPTTPAAVARLIQVVGGTHKKAVTFQNVTRSFSLGLNSISSPDALSVVKTFATTVFPERDVSLCRQSMIAEELVGTLSIVDPYPVDGCAFSQFGQTFETAQTYRAYTQTAAVNVALTDETYGLTFDSVFAIGMTTSAAGRTIEARWPIGTVVGTLNTSGLDPEAYSIIDAPANDSISGTSTPMTSQFFTITNNVLRANTVITVKGTARIPVDVRTTHRTTGLTDGRIFTVTVNPVAATVGNPTTVAALLAPDLPGTAVASTVIGGGAVKSDSLSVPAVPPTSTTVRSAVSGTTVGASQTLVPPSPPMQLPVPQSMIAGNTPTTPDLVGPPALTTDTPNEPMIPIPLPETGGSADLSAPQDTSLPWYQPEIYTVSVSAFVDDPSFHSSNVSGLSLPDNLRPVEMPADRFFFDLSNRQQETSADEEVDLALWVLEQPQEQSVQMRAAVDAEVFASSDEPGTGAWGLTFLGSAAALKAIRIEREEDKVDERLQLPSE